MFKISLLSCFVCLYAVVLPARQVRIIEANVASGDISLATKLVLPTNRGDDKLPALIIVHGSGRYEWEIYKPLVEKLATQGLAVVFFDKRGTGASTGRFIPVNVNNGHRVFDQLSDGVVSVAEWVHRQPQIDQKRIGVLGLSQGGWIGPMAVNKSDKLSFMAILSGPVCSLGHEQLFSQLAGDETGPSKIPLDEINQRVEAFQGRLGFDSYPEVEQLIVPALWLYGEKDASNPVNLSINNLTEITEKNEKANFRFIVYPNADHGLHDINTREKIDYESEIRKWIYEVMY